MIPIGAHPKLTHAYAILVSFHSKYIQLMYAITLITWISQLNSILATNKMYNNNYYNMPVVTNILRFELQVHQLF